MHTCVGCKQIDHCQAPLTCDSPTTSRCGPCYPGYTKNTSGTAEICTENHECAFSEWGGWSLCDRCAHGRKERSRTLTDNSGFEAFCVTQLRENSECGFPCANEAITSLSTVGFYLYNSLTDWLWFEEQLRAEGISQQVTVTYDVFSVSVILSSSKRSTKECEENEDVQFAQQLLEKTAKEILPSISPSSWVGSITGDDTEQCVITIAVVEPADHTGIIVGVVVGVVLGLVVLVTAFYFFTREHKLDMKSLPKEVRYFYEDFYSSSRTWEAIGEGHVKVYKRKLDPESKYWTRMLFLLRTHCKGRSIEIEEAYAVFNPTLVGAFISQRNIIRRRMISDPALFKTQSFKNTENPDMREWVMQRFRDRVEGCPWNDEEKGPAILPAVHGTDLNITWKICETGFANLSTLDDGFFGKGIYFTSYALYALPYFEKKQTPAIIISWILPGNTYPVTEKSTDKKGFSGKPLKSGYNSHYVATSSKGQPVQVKSEDAFDEIVVSQEAQITPAFVLKVKATNLTELRRDYERAAIDRDESL
eukprot:TRINITY_DN5626_c0_g3_i2.p1 TRINITY_DN5626_c0_g3~~TRINITY_DN5626_c0_g3_i2.p1  ORF type:complete len:533 (-),score=92.68 TRINITY_DN5626_c0_g3_i2:42-1640(-)